MCLKKHLKTSIYTILGSTKKALKKLTMDKEQIWLADGFNLGFYVGNVLNYPSSGGTEIQNGLMNKDL